MVQNSVPNLNSLSLHPGTRTGNPEDLQPVNQPVGFEIPRSPPQSQPEVFTEEDEEDNDVETYISKDGSLISKSIRSRDHLERNLDQAGPSSRPSGRSDGETRKTRGEAPVTRNELMKFMNSFKGEIKEMINNKAGSSKSQPAKKTPNDGKKKKNPIKDRQPTPHPKEKATAKLDWSKILMPRRPQPEGKKTPTFDAREVINRRRQQQSESASTSSFLDSFKQASARNSMSLHESRTGGKSVNTEPQLMIGSMPYAPQAQYG